LCRSRYEIAFVAVMFIITTNRKVTESRLPVISVVTRAKTTFCRGAVNRTLTDEATKDYRIKDIAIRQDELFDVYQFNNIAGCNFVAQ